DPNEIRDLFVRLQSGLPLNPQETRDAWPGQFTEFVLGLGGKPELARYPGHLFFQELMGLNPRTDRGKARQFAAQIALMFFTQQEQGRSAFPDINAKGINDFYFSHIDFDSTSQPAKRLISILDKVTQLLRGRKRPKLKAHDAIHLILLVDALWGDYTHSWEGKLPQAIDRFSEALASAKLNKDTANPDEFWIRYGQWTRVNSDRGERIAHRHAFYVEKMFEFLAPLQPKDPQRSFGEVEREILYFRSNKRCAVCDAPVIWNEAEIHHVIEHSEGGSTDMNNAALVHKGCHPKGDAATQDFAVKFSAAKQARQAQPVQSDEDAVGYLWKHSTSRLFLPHDTEIRMHYKNKDYYARVQNDLIIYDGKSLTPSELANQIADGTSRNAWRDLYIKFPDDEGWRLAHDLREAPEATLDGFGL
ncbi:MAG: HNH endonuclease, partial [Alphaproteobacteria bacterium]|nr:HNH endonuclease [Alphaproteobacteria bacterium]